MRNFHHLADLKGRWAVLTGASGHLGLIFARTLLDLGANIVITDKDSQSLDERRNLLQISSEQEIIALKCDLEIESDRTSFINRVVSEVGSLDILINNAAFVGDSPLEGWGSRFVDQSVSSWRRALEVNLTAVFHLCRDFSPHFRESRQGSIVNISSIYGYQGPRWNLYENTELGNPVAYSVSKGGILQLTRWLATTLAPQVRVNCIVAGGILRNQPSTFIQKYSENVPLQRMAKEDDFIGTIGFLCSDLSRYITGESIHLDGGWSIW